MIRTVLFALLLVACSTAGESVQSAGEPLTLALDDDPGVILIEGQSNAVALMRNGSADVEQDPRVISWWASWVQAEGDAAALVSPGSIGQWGLHLGVSLARFTAAPVQILNGAHVGEPISFFQRNDVNRVDATTNYGALLARVRAAGAVGRVHALVWWQGESDGATGGSNLTGNQYRDAFRKLYVAWHEDYPALRRIYVVQVRPGCVDPTPDLIDGQRRLVDDWPDVTVVASNAFPGHDGCHYARAGYWAAGDALALLLERDLYGGAKLRGLDAPNVDHVSYADASHAVVDVILRHPEQHTMSADDGVAKWFVAVNVAATKVESTPTGLRLTFPGAVAGPLTYAGHPQDGPMVVNQRALGLLGFVEPIR